MRIFLVRHGETVDNVAQVYGGSRDVSLTNHGFQQAKRLGLFFKTSGIVFTHIFSSTLRRAVKTAELIREPQIDGDGVNSQLEVVQLPSLVEQDFGSLEGKPWHVVATEGAYGNAQGDAVGGDAGFVKMESKESMIRRLDSFLDDYILPLTCVPAEDGEPVVAVVSHGISLSVLWQRLLARLPRNSVSLLPELAAVRGPLLLERLGSWSNTGYLELHLERSNVDIKLKEEATPVVVEDNSRGPLNRAEGSTGLVVPDNVTAYTGSSVLSVDDKPVTISDTAQPPPRPTLAGWKTVIRVVNGREHLKGLKRTGGGLGSAKYDEGQKRIETFFPKKAAN